MKEHNLKHKQSIQTAFRFSPKLMSGLKHFCIDQELKYKDVVSDLLEQFLNEKGYFKK